MRRFWLFLTIGLVAALLAACGDDSPMEKPGGTAASVELEDLPAITLPEEIEEMGYIGSLIQLTPEEWERPHFYEEISQEQIGAVLGEEEFSLAGWVPPEGWYLEGRANYQQNGETVGMSCWAGNAPPNSDDGDYAAFMVLPKDLIDPELFETPGEVYDFAGRPVTVMWSAGRDQLYCVAWVQPDPDRGLAAIFLGDCRRNEERQVADLLLVLNRYMAQCVTGAKAIDLSVLDRAAPYPDPTPDPYRVVRLTSPEDVSVDDQGRMTFDQTDFTDLVSQLAPQPVGEGEPVVDEDGTAWQCLRTLTLVFPERVWTDEDKDTALFVADTRVYGFLESAQRREIRELSAGTHWAGLVRGKLWQPDPTEDEDDAAMDFMGYDQENIREMLLLYKDDKAYNRGKALAGLARTYASQAGLEEFIQEVAIPEGALAEVEGVSIDARGWLHFEDADLEEAYRLLAPAMDAAWQAEAASNAPISQGWAPFRAYRDKLIPQEGVLKIMVPVLLWQDDPEQPSQKIYACYQKDWEIEDREGDKKFIATGMSQYLAALTWSPETRQWQPWVDWELSGSFSEEGSGSVDREQLAEIRKGRSRHADAVLEQIRLLKNNFAWLTGRGEYLK